MSVTWLDKNALLKTVKAKIKGAGIIMDIGCGIRPQTFIKPRVHICCEPYGEYVDHLKGLTAKDRSRHYVIVQTTWHKAVEMFPAGSVDTVFLLDLIEHLEKEESRRLLRATEAIARKQVVLFTPLGFMPQSHPDGRDAWGFGGGSMQEHKSGWLPEDFDDSWDLYVCRAFHMYDNMGKELPKPFGAFYAIRNSEGRKPR